MCRLLVLAEWIGDRESGRKDEGKIEGRGTRRGLRPGLHVGWRGTRAGARRAAVWLIGLADQGFRRALTQQARWSLRRGRP